MVGLGTRLEEGKDSTRTIVIAGVGGNVIVIFLQEPCQLVVYPCISWESQGALGRRLCKGMDEFWHGVSQHHRSTAKVKVDQWRLLFFKLLILVDVAATVLVVKYLVASRFPRPSNGLTHCVGHGRASRKKRLVFIGIAVVDDVVVHDWKRHFVTGCCWTIYIRGWVLGSGRVGHGEKMLLLLIIGVLDERLENEK